jgi:hypothetical protein
VSIAFAFPKLRAASLLLVIVQFWNFTRRHGGTEKSMGICASENQSLDSFHTHSFVPLRLGVSIAFRLC